MKEKEIRRARFSPVLAVCRCRGQKFTDNLREQRVCRVENETSGGGPLDERKRRGTSSGLDRGPCRFSQVLESGAESWTAQARN